MRKYTGSSTQVCGFDRAKMVDFLRTEFPHDTAKEIAKALNAKQRTVENWINPARTGFPSAEHIAVLIGLFGARFLFHTMLNPPLWVSAAAQEEELAALALKREEIQSKYRADEES